MKLRRFTYEAVFLWLLLSFLPLKAYGHVFPDHSDPRVGSETNGSPSIVKIWFDGQMEPIFSTLQVLDSSGKEVSLQDSRVDEKDPTILEVSVPPLPPGKYEVDWKALARDGHLTEGKFKFTIK